MLLQQNITTWNRKSIVFVHGIGRQPPNYSEPLYRILRVADQATADGARWHEVAYDSVNDAMDAKVTQFQGALVKNGKDSISAISQDFLVDLINFLFAVDPYNWINTVTEEALVEVVEQGQQLGVQQKEHEVYVISHSLGTVVFYETLHAIVNNAQTLGLSSNFRIKGWFTLGCPLALIKANQARIPSLNDKFFLRTAPIGRPTRVNSFTGQTQTNVLDWFNLRQKFDPVASLVPLDQATANGALSTETMVFDKFHTGANPHDFANYLTEYASFLMSTIHG